MKDLKIRASSLGRLMTNDKDTAKANEIYNEN